MTDKKPTSMSINERVQRALLNSTGNNSPVDEAKLIAALNTIIVYVDELEQRVAELEKKSET